MKSLIALSLLFALLGSVRIANAQVADTKAAQVATDALKPSVASLAKDLRDYNENEQRTAQEFHAKFDARIQAVVVGLKQKAYNREAALLLQVVGNVDPFRPSLLNSITNLDRIAGHLTN